MAANERDRGAVGFLMFRAAASTILVLIGLVGAGVTAGAGYMLVELWRHPPEPPGQLAVGAFLILAAAGVVTVLGSVGGLVLLARWSRAAHSAREPRMTPSGPERGRSIAQRKTSAVFLAVRDRPTDGE